MRTGLHTFTLTTDSSVQFQKSASARRASLAATLAIALLFSCAGMQAMAIDSAASGDWHVGATWVGGTAPTAGADANILSGHTVTVNEILTTYSVDNLTVQNGGVLTHTANSSTEQYKILFSIAENLTVESGGAIDVSELGYAANQGPGESDGRAGASHGGGRLRIPGDHHPSGHLRLDQQSHQSRQRISLP